MKRSPTKSKATRKTADEILGEYDFSSGARNTYASRYAAGSTVVVLEPDVAAAFPTSGAVNEALRALASIIEKHNRKRSVSRPRT
jgi:hypothetical protein